ncbi:2',3'-cyclic-nucleotide 3'-phosphodiesterase [Pagrus major]|uniref:2',3'-cyclic-nucleotide 3'-phosphodiesterase n=1 Tax=Pagrus major TaxID=143350 RepID=UPI003CC8CF86
MDTEKSDKVLHASETPQPEETVMEKEVVSKLETAEETEKPPAAGGDTAQMAVNGHDTEVITSQTEDINVTETVAVSAEEPKMEIEENLPTETSETESMPVEVAPPEPVESSETISDPVEALDTEPENIQPEQPVPENDPEPLPVQTPLAESAPEPEPEKLAETVPEAELEKQTLPEPVMLQQPVDIQPPSQEEKETELKTTMDAVAEEVAKMSVADVEKPAEPVSVTVASPDKTAVTVSVTEASPEKMAETVSATEAAPEKPAATMPVTEASPEKPKEAVTVKEEASAEIEDKKEPEKSAESVKGAEAAPEGEGVKSEKDAEPQQEEDPVPAPGSLSFAFLEREQTKDALRISRTLVVLRGLPGSGKSFLARAIADTYKEHCSIICADDHGVKPESPEASVEGYKALDEAVVARSSAGTSSPLLLVVDDTNHAQDRLARLGEIAEQHNLVAVFLEPRTEWSRDVAQLIKKTKRGLEEAKLEAMRGPIEEMSLPLYFGWFLLSSVQDKVRCTSMDFLKTLDTMEAFKKHLIDFTGKAEKEVDLEQYFQAKGTLHCTTKFCDYGKAEGAKEYAQIPAVKDLNGSVFELSLSALFVTPRTVGARVSLTKEQLVLWPADAEKEVESAASLPLGSRAHVTLGCAEGVDPVQTGLDLLDILALQQGGQQGELVEEMELGSLTYYGEGRWLLSLREPICTPACFSSFYERKELVPAKKEQEKKKKQKCSIL